MKSKLMIISGYRGLKEYMNRAEKADSPDHEKLWHEHVIKPYWNEWAKGQFNEDRIRQEMKKPIMELDELNKGLDILNDSDIEGIINSTYKKIVSLLPSQVSERAVCIYIDTTINETVHGVVGSCVGDNILIRINPLVKGWQDYLPWVLAHEYNHSVWGYHYFYLKGNRSISLLSSLINEGIADSFGKLISPNITPNWTHCISNDEELRQWSIMQEYLLCEDTFELHSRFFFGNKSTGTPPGVGYTIGFNIVQSYMKSHEDVTIKEITEIDSQVIFNESSYKMSI